MLSERVAPLCACHCSFTPPPMLGQVPVTAALTKSHGLSTVNQIIKRLTQCTVLQWLSSGCQWPRLGTLYTVQGWHTGTPYGAIKNNLRAHLAVVRMPAKSLSPLSYRAQQSWREFQKILKRCLEKAKDKSVGKRVQQLSLLLPHSRKETHLKAFAKQQRILWPPSSNTKIFTHWNVPSSLGW